MTKPIFFISGASPANNRHGLSHVSFDGFDSHAWELSPSRAPAATMSPDDDTDADDPDLSSLLEPSTSSPSWTHAVFVPGAIAVDCAVGSGVVGVVVVGSGVDGAVVVGSGVDGLRVVGAGVVVASGRETFNAAAAETSSANPPQSLWLVCMNVVHVGLLG